MTRSDPKNHQHRWILIMLSGAMLVSVTLGIRQVFGLFLIPVSTHLETGVHVFSLAIALQNLVWGASSPIFGAIADKYGPWRVAAFGVLVFASGLFVMATLLNEAGIFLGQILVGIGIGSAVRPSQNPEPTRRANRSRFRAGRRASHQTDNDGFFVSVYAATSGAVGFGAWFATLRFAPIPSEIRPIVVAVRLRAKNETNPKSNQPTTLSTPSKRLQTPRLTTHPVDSSQPSPSVRSSSIPSSPSPSPSSSFLPVPRRPVRSLATSFAPVAGSPLAASSSPNPSPGSHHPRARTPSEPYSHSSHRARFHRFPPRPSCNNAT